MNKNSFFRVLMLFILIMFLTMPGCERKKPVIIIHDGQWDSMQLINAIAKYIIEKGYGYEVKIVIMTSKDGESAILRGEIDLTLELWAQNRLEWFNQNIQDKNIISLGPSFDDSAQFWMIPKWVADQYNIKTIEDMKENWELFKDPQDYTKGLFYNGIIGWRSSDVNEVKLEAYGLNKYYNIINPVSPESFAEALIQAQENHQPIFCYYWSPTAIMGAYDWMIVEEPPYNPEVWAKILEASENKELRPLKEACAYQSFSIEKIATKNFQKKAPDLCDMLKKMNLGIDNLNKTLGWVQKNHIKNWDTAAVYYLNNFEDVWKEWVSPAAYKKIKAELKKENSVK
ncbi:MAG: glycine betaine ABC transporter substrate-binding protein [bacterium]|nr:glycine betaine ABC transporter substrate-binding protein [bacterium]